MTETVMKRDIVFNGLKDWIDKISVLRRSKFEGGKRVGKPA
jgi:hypothetical protein